VNDRVRREFVLSLALAGVVVGIGLCFVGQKSAVTAETQSLGYKASNATSVMAAILACYLCGLWLRRKTEKKWGYWLLPVSMACLVLGSAISEGRGGWVAGIAGLLYLCARGGLRRRSLLIAAVVPLFVITLYLCSPVFQKRVDATFVPGYSGVSAVEMDDDGRVGNFTMGVTQFRNSPILGTGFYHRGGQTGIYPSGSHNFFLQMFLETGFPGGLLMLAIFWRLWRQAGTNTAKQAGLEVPTKAALVAAAVGGMSGEYFYGALPLFALLAVYASCGSLPARAGTFAVFRINTLQRNWKNSFLLIGYVRTKSAFRRTLAAH
jgi:O-antigen ligase